MQLANVEKNHNLCWLATFANMFTHEDTMSKERLSHGIHYMFETRPKCLIFLSTREAMESWCQCYFYMLEDSKLRLWSCP